MATVAIDNVGPIEHLDIDIPEGGGVVVLLGRNGAGKSLALEATQKLLGGKTKPTASDGAAKGKVSGFGARISVASRITRSGKLEATSLEGSFDLASLVDPGILDPEAADAKRIKALLSLLGLDADPSLFYELVDGEAGYMQLGIEQTDDVVLMARRIKSKLELRARDQESVADKLIGESSAMLKDVGDFPPSICRDVEGLQSQLETAIRLQSEIAVRVDHASKDGLARRTAEAALAGLPETQAHTLETSHDEWKAKAEKLHAEMAVLERKHNEAISEQARLYEAWQAEVQRDSDRDVFAATLDAAAVEAPTVAQITKAADDIGDCRERIAQATLAVAADEKAVGANAKRKQSEVARDTADRYRESARSTDDVLSGVVAQLDVGLKVIGGRLCTETKRGSTPLSELSHGERWKIAIDLGVKRVGERGVLAIPQESWESLDPRNRELIHDHAQKRGVVIITAEAALGELRCESL